MKTRIFSSICEFYLATLASSMYIGRLISVNCVINKCNNKMAEFEGILVRHSQSFYRAAMKFSWPRT